MSPPVLLVHGFLASPALMLPMQWRLGRRGIHAERVSLSLGAIQDVRTLTTELAWNVERVLRETGSRQVDLVGISMGGVLGLMYAQRAAHLQHVRRLVCVGTPFQGAPVANLVLPILGAFSRGIWQIRPGSSLLTEMLTKGVPSDVEAYSIAMTGDLISPPENCELPGAENILLAGMPSPWTHQWLVASNDTFNQVASILKQ